LIGRLVLTLDLSRRRLGTPRAAAPSPTSSLGLFAGDEHPPGMATPFSCLAAARNGAPKT
jgi:hypothetical protein